MKKVYDNVQDECNFFFQDLRCTNHTNNVQQYDKLYFGDDINHQQNLIYFSNQFNQSHEVHNQIISADLPEDENQIQIQNHLMNSYQDNYQTYHHKDLSQFDLNQSQKLLHSHHHEQIKILKEQSKKLSQNDQQNKLIKQKSGNKRQNKFELPQKWVQKMNNIMQQKSINQFSTKHNRNMAKFFIRIFSKHIKNYVNNYENIKNEEELKVIQEKLGIIQDKKSICLKDLEYVFGGQQSRVCRQYLFKILREQLNKQIIKSQDIQNKNAYILCSKVYRLRCFSKYLVSRLQSR